MMLLDGWFGELEGLTDCISLIQKMYEVSWVELDFD